MWRWPHVKACSRTVHIFNVFFFTLLYFPHLSNHMSNFYIKNMFLVIIWLSILPWKHSLVSDNPEATRTKAYFFWLHSFCASSAQARSSRDVRMRRNVSVVSEGTATCTSSDQSARLATPPFLLASNDSSVPAFMCMPFHGHGPPLANTLSFGLDKRVCVAQW